jgi:hypothetical protein
MVVEETCLKQEIHQMMENGWFEDQMFDLPSSLDKFDASLVRLKVLQSSKSETEKFVKNLFLE